MTGYRAVLAAVEEAAEWFAIRWETAAVGEPEARLDPSKRDAVGDEPVRRSRRLRPHHHAVCARRDLMELFVHRKITLE